jgi:DNA-binding transcriptional MerR regulator
MTNEEIERKYWTISDVAKELNETTSCIRHWEGAIPQLRASVRRLSRGGFMNRRYTKKDQEMLKKARYLIREKGMSLWAVKRELYG